MKKYHVAYGDGGAYHAFGYETRRDAEIVLTIAQLHDPKAYIVEEVCHTTNADRIRAMSDEELAKIIRVLVRHLRCLNPTCGDCDQCPLTRICDLTEDEVLDWLHKSAEEE